MTTPYIYVNIIQICVCEYPFIGFIQWEEKQMKAFGNWTPIFGGLSNGRMVYGAKLHRCCVPGSNPQNVHSSIRTKIVSFTANAILCLNVQKLHFTGEGYSVPLGKAELILLLWRYQARTGMTGYRLTRRTILCNLFFLNQYKVPTA